MNYRLRPHLHMPRIYLYRKPVDFCKSVRGLGRSSSRILGQDYTYVLHYTIGFSDGII